MANPDKPDKPDKPENNVTLTAKTLSGSASDKFNVHQQARKVLELAYKEIGLNPNPARPYVMKVERSGQELQADQPLDSHVQDGDTILIQERHPTDG